MGLYKKVDEIFKAMGSKVYVNGKPQDWDKTYSGAAAYYTEFDKKMEKFIGELKDHKALIEEVKKMIEKVNKKAKDLEEKMVLTYDLPSASFLRIADKLTAFPKTAGDLKKLDGEHKKEKDACIKVIKALLIPPLK